MSQADRLRSMDARTSRAFVRSGIADAAVYRAKGTMVDVPCTVELDRDVQQLGEFGQVIGSKVAASLFLAEVPTPKQGDSLTVGSEAWVLESKVSQDESRSKWVLNG